MTRSFIIKSCRVISGWRPMTKETARGTIQILLACTLFIVDQMLHVTSLHLPARAMSGDWSAHCGTSPSQQSAELPRLPIDLPTPGGKFVCLAGLSFYDSVFKLDVNRGWSASTRYRSPKISSTIDKLIFYTSFERTIGLQALNPVQRYPFAGEGRVQARGKVER